MNKLFTLASTIDKSIYTTQADNIINKTGVKIIKIIGGVGASAFTIAVLVITLFLLFGSISAQKKGTWWWALLSCFAAAFIFFSAYLFAPAIQKLATG